MALSVAGGLAALLAHWSGPMPRFERASIPGAFWFSTLFLICGSLSLHAAVGYIRREKQRPFRICLWLGVISGTLFVGVQSYGLWALVRYFRQGIIGSDELVVGEFAAVFAGLHAIHFLVALLFVIYTTLHALSHRYDHEYYWGIKFCAWFWHLLGIVWGVILAVMILMTLFINGPARRTDAMQPESGRKALPRISTFSYADSAQRWTHPRDGDKVARCTIQHSSRPLRQHLPLPGCSDC